MNDWLMGFYHAHPVITCFLLFLAGYAAGRAAEREGRSWWS
jgi:hypothetical protein